MIWGCSKTCIPITIYPLISNIEIYLLASGHGVSSVSPLQQGVLEAEADGILLGRLVL